MKLSIKDIAAITWPGISYAKDEILSSDDENMIRHAMSRVLYYALYENGYHGEGWGPLGTLIEIAETAQSRNELEAMLREEFSHTDNPEKQEKWL